MHHNLAFLLITILCLLMAITILCGCDDDDDDDDSGGPADDDDDDDDSSDDDDDDDDDDTSSQPEFKCEDLGLTVREFIDADHDSSLYAVAADVTIPTTDGDWNLKDNWTGCEVYLFIQDTPSQNSGFSTHLWSRDVEDFLEALPENTHAFFMSDYNDEGIIEAGREKLMPQIEAYMETLAEDEQVLLNRRLHFVESGSKELEGWLGEIMTSPGWGAGIDWFQRVRYIGSYADPTRPKDPWFEPNLSMATNEAIYYNFESDREDYLDANPATVVNLFPGDPMTTDNGFVYVTLPDQTTMETFDTLEVDLYFGCIGDGEFGDCPAWDFIANLYLCDELDPDTCNTEIARWITTYHREGRWVHDISAMLPYLANGGERRFRLYTDNPYNVYLDFRFLTKGKSTRPTELNYLFSGGAFDLDYNDAYDPIDVFIPATAVKVELATMITGHGMSNPGNCAEFCNTTHHFYVNGTENMLDFPWVGNNYGCMEQVAEGTVPNQYGTWWYGRAGWCPGKEVQMTMTDITSQVTLGDDNTFDYEGFYNGEPHPGGPSIVMSSWVVVSE